MIRVVVGDIASAAADAVVRPANTRLEPMMPALRLDEAAGPSFLQQLTVRTELAVGSAVVTGGGDLGSEFVVHAVIGTGPGDVTADGVRRAMEAALWQCTQWRIATLATPVPTVGDLSIGPASAAIARALESHVRNAELPANVLVIIDSPAESGLLDPRLGRGGAF